MVKVKNEYLRELFAELRFAPLKEKVKELDAAEKLLKIVRPDKQYPFEFVCFRITEYRLREDLSGKIIEGAELVDDLLTFVKSVSRQLSLAADGQGQKVHTIDSLAEKFSVSTRTVTRWQRKGLVARTFVFDSGQKRLGFMQSVVDEFVEKNPELVVNASGFTPVGDQEKKQIVKHAEALLKAAELSRHQVIIRIAEMVSRSKETVRAVLLEHEKTQAGRSLFKKRSGVISPKEASQIYKLYQHGVAIPEMMQKFQRSRSSIYRIINNRRAKSLAARKISYIDSKDFLEEGAGQKIVPVCIDSLSAVVGADGRVKLLNRQQEMELFRKYNYLKYLACVGRSKLSKKKLYGNQLKKIEEHLDCAEYVKKMIIESNMPLVVSIASKHLGKGHSLAELVSEGNISLMRAVEKFDYTRGYRFSTYASWAIAKDYARKIPQEASRLDKPGAADVSYLQQDMRIAGLADVAAVERARTSLFDVIKNNLTEREQYIIQSHFALDTSVIKKKPKTLKEIGQTLDLSKERVRQIELAALQKLRQSLSEEEFELLTG